uniref:NADH:quinone oxidoreductase/Mrp antiporter transmembrane domain-containing protein n=1 Tax=candidate division WOR-3 bacterium TaxID=2052148 RepID=A0A7C4GH03_UNCW3
MFGALLHLGYHALTKPVLFFAAGNLHQHYHTLDFRRIGRGVGRVLPGTALVLTLAAIAVSGLPPFGLFVSELTIVAGSFKGGAAWAGAVMLAALLLVGCGHEVSAEGATRRRVLREDRERSCWQALYRLEEEFKASGIKASVMAREGDVDDIHTLANNINADLIVLHASSLAGANYRLPDEFIASLPCPIFIVNTE